MVLLKEAVDLLIPQVKNFEELLEKLQASGYEIKRGKYISCRAPGQERFTRLKTLGADYTEEAIRKRIAGIKSHTGKKPMREHKISLLIDKIEIPDIEEKISELEQEIQRIMETDPYQYKFLLGDKEAVEEKKRSLEEELKQYQDYGEQLDGILNSLMMSGVTITWEMN